MGTNPSFLLLGIVRIRFTNVMVVFSDSVYDARGFTDSGIFIDVE